MDKYLKAIKQNVCSICVDSSEHGTCLLTDKESCAVEFYLPQIVEIVTNALTDDIHEIHRQLKDVICINCRSDGNGNCYLRDDANCSLDRYFSIIVETIQKVNGEKLY